ncbi:GNAT family N-acetyltransferase [uncultured Roseovarius sp.]|uniref:GNAT family N-acetyltransferase n=1 Tax=uncultured Roseovarius sp. TaxID=293344 RepID=UPI00260D1F06|nr:GNAT family N-acetyltransferase [uncultured Roseovarius sp.]
MTLTQAPELETPRLILRGPEPQDIEPMIEFLLDKDRAGGFGAAANRGEAWRWFVLNVGHWHIHGYGYFTIEMKDTGKTAGITGIWNPEGWPEPELGWVVFDGFEGKGIAYEAAARARRYAYEDLSFDTLTSNIVPGNSRSIALAERLGASFEREYENIHMGHDLLYRHPGPDTTPDGDDDDGSVEAYA